MEIRERSVAHGMVLERGGQTANLLINCNCRMEMRGFYPHVLCPKGWYFYRGEIDLDR